MSKNPDSQRFTVLLQRWHRGDGAALNHLSEQIHNELHRLALKLMHSESAIHTLQPTALVNEAYLNLLNCDVSYHNRVHFFNLAGRMMRRILVDHARARSSAKRGDGIRCVTLEEQHVGETENIDILALNDAMDALAEFDQPKAEMLELHFFAGLTTAEIADLYQVSAKTIERNTRLAKAWLRQILQPV